MWKFSPQKLNFTSLSTLDGAVHDLQCFFFKKSSPLMQWNTFHFFQPEVRILNCNKIFITLPAWIIFHFKIKL